MVFPIMERRHRSSAVPMRRVRRISWIQVSRFLEGLPCEAVSACRGGPRNQFAQAHRERVYSHGPWHRGRETEGRCHELRSDSMRLGTDGATPFDQRARAIRSASAKS